ncbi:MAG: ABC transporter permease subunit [Myxococcales bacterium]|nr:ABC transporter permease subunit [Myxococcales bacterium]
MIALVLLVALAPVRVGSKQFTESVLLGELARQTLEQAGVPAIHRRELGGTRVLWEALLAGQIDVYPEYTGTLTQEILPADARPLDEALRARGLRASAPLGFEDTYAIGVRREAAARLGLRRLSDLARHPELRYGLSSEFLRRGDGWPRLQRVYGLSEAQVTGLQHDLAYRALQEGAIDATDLYSTDAEIRAFDLAVLEDDRRAFPEYRAVFLFRAGLPAEAQRNLARLEGAIDAGAMVAMNARARLDHVTEAQAAAEFLKARLGGAGPASEEGLAGRILRRTAEHLWLVSISLVLAIALAVPLGILAARNGRLAQLVLGASGLIQTIPSLALLVFMIPLLGIGARPAIAALFLYGLLPIVRATHAGLTGIPAELRESAEALGLPPWARLRLVELPMASRAVLSGIQTSAVINVGTATLGALIGAGGYGQPILTGIRLADTGIILEGAVPAAALALLVQWLFDLLGRAIVSKGLR